VTSSFRLGRLAGVEIGIHWSWALIFALIVWSLADVVFPETNPGLANGTYLAMAIIAVLLFFASLLAHELGHATRAAKEGMEIDGITLWIFGGVARFRGMFPSAGAEFRIAIAGPIVSLAVGVLALGAALLVPLPDAVDGVLFWLGYVNLVVLVFNLMPALPLDGGRVLRSALWARKHDFLAATRTAAAVGQGFGQLLIGFGVLTVLLGGSLGGLWLVFIGWFILAAAEAERAGAETHEALSGVLVRDVMVTDPITVDPDLDLEQFIDRCFLAHRHVAYPVVEDERPVGLVSFRSVLALPREQWPQRRVRDAMVELARLPELGPETPLETAVERISQTESNRGLVLDRGRLAGLLSITDATRVIEARRAQGADPGSQRRHEPAARTTPTGLGASEGTR
jgi:Zn-dependent protease/predicted transcriptional regulator